MDWRKGLKRFVAITLLLVAGVSAFAQLSSDDQSFLDQLKAQAAKGIAPTADQIQRLMQIQQKMTNHFGANPAGQKSIPIRITVSGHWHSSLDSSDPAKRTKLRSDGDTIISVSADGTMDAVVNGNAKFTDLTAGGASRFTLKGDKSGRGTYDSELRVHSEAPGTSGIPDEIDINDSDYNTSGSLSTAGAGAAFLTTGSDDLLITSSCGGTLSGQTVVQLHAQGSRLDDHNQPKHFDSSTSNTFPAKEVHTDIFPGASLESYQMQQAHGGTMPTPTMKLSYKALADAIAKGASKTFTATESFDFKVGDTHYAGSGTISFTLNPKPVDLVIEPDDPAGYDKWLPLPGTDDNHGFTFKGATPMKVHVVLAKKGGAATQTKTQPSSDVAGKFDIYLHDVSQNPGVCMNFPAKGGGSAQHGLYFAKTQPNGIVVDDETHVHTSGLVLEATVIVNVRDTGAYGQIDAKCDALGLDSIVRRTQKESLAIPKDDKATHIAQYWLEKNQMTDKQPDWDACDTPSGWSSPGDGISLYDKYRGVLIDDGNGTEVFSRIDPTVRNLLIYVPGATDQGPQFQGPIGPTPGFHMPGAPEAAAIKQGCQIYGSTTQVKISFVHSSDRLQTLKASYPNWFTFNETPYTKYKGCAVVIFDDGKDTDYYDDGVRHEYIGTTLGVSGSDDASSRDPSQIDHIVVRLNAALNQMQSIVYWLKQAVPQDNSPTAWLATACHTAGVDKMAVAQTTDQNHVQLARALFTFSVAHELGHATGAKHHEPDSDGGAPACPMRYWQALWGTDVINFCLGKWDPTKSAPDGSPWAFCEVDKPMLHLHP